MVAAWLLWMACASPEVGVSPGQLAPELASTPEVGRERLTGHRTAIVFWASWSGASRQLGGPIQAWVDASPGGRLVAVNLGEDRVVAEASAASWLPEGAWLPDPEGLARAGWQVEAVPTVIVIDEEAVVRHRGTSLPLPSDISWGTP